MDAAPARSPRALSSRGCAVLCAAHANGRVSLLLGLAAEANADAILHVGHFEAEPGQEGPDSDLAEYIRGDRTIPIPVFVLVSHQELGDKREPSFASIPNVTIIQNEASRVLYIPSKSCAIHLLDMHSICSKVEAFYQCPDTLEAFHNATNDVMNMLFPPKPPLATSELKIFVGSVNMSGSLLSVLEPDVILSHTYTQVPSKGLTSIDSYIRTIYDFLRELDTESALDAQLLHLLETSLHESTRTFQQFGPQVCLESIDRGHMIIEGTASSVTSTFVRSDVRERKKLKRAVQVTAKTGSNTTPNRGTWAAFSSKSTAAGVSPQPEWLHSAEAEALTSALDSATWIIDDGSSKGDTITAGQSSDVESTLFRTDDTLSDMTEVSDFFVEGICTVLVGNFPDDTLETDLKARFRGVNILRCKIVNNKKADRKPFAFVDVKESDRDSILKMNGERFQGLKLKVEYDPSRLEKLGRKRHESGKLESTLHAEISLPHTLKKSSSLNSLEFYNLALSSQHAKATPATSLMRTRSQLMTSSQLAQTYNSWSSVTATVDSFSVGQSTDALVAWSSQASKTAWRVKFDPSSLHNSPESDSQQLAVKSTSWDSPPRKQSPFFTGAHWERSLIVDPGSGKLSAGSASSASKWAPGSETSSSKTISPTLHVSNSGLGVKDVSWNFNSQQHATQQQPSDGVEAPRGVHLMNEAFSHAASPPFTSPANLDFSMSGREGTPRGASLWEIPERPIGPPLPTPATSWESSAAHRFENSVEFPGYRGGVGRIDNPSASMAYNDRRMDPKLIAQSMAMESVMNFNQQIMNGALHAGATGPMGSGFSGPPLPPRRNSFASKPSSDSFGVPSGGVGGVGGEFDAWNSFGPRRGSLPHISDGYIGADASTMAPYPAKVVSYPQQQQQSVQRPQSLQAWNQPHQPAILGTQKSIFISQNNIW